LKQHIGIVACAAGLALLLAYTYAPAHAQGQAPAAGQAAPAGGGRGPQAPPPDPTKPHKLEITDGTKARYKVQEQLAGISFPSEAVGTTEAVTGTIVVNPDGSIGPQSKLTVDLKSLKSDQALRDNYIQGRVLETDKFPQLEFAPKKAVGLTAPLPAGGQSQAGFQLVGDMTVHGVTKEATWNVVATLGNDVVAGRATSTIQFAAFNMMKPTLARLLSVDDKILLEVEFRCKRTVS
jgi:polyisoprenoid-binding protein YceI